MRISDWSSDVCSSDLEVVAFQRLDRGEAGDARGHLTRPDTAGLRLRPQDLFQEVAERRFLDHGRLGRSRPGALDRLEVQFGAEIGDALVLEVRHCAAPVARTAS